MASALGYHMRVSLLFAVVVMTGCVGGGSGGGGGSCELGECINPGEITMYPGDTFINFASGLSDGRSIRIAALCLVDGPFETAIDWERAVVFDIETGVAARLYTRNANETIESHECLTNVNLPPSLTPPHDWRFGHVQLKPCRPGDGVPCGCEDGQRGERRCVEVNTGDPYNPDAWTDCDCG